MFPLLFLFFFLSAIFVLLREDKLRFLKKKKNCFVSFFFRHDRSSVHPPWSVLHKTNESLTKQYHYFFLEFLKSVSASQRHLQYQLHFFF